LTARIKVEYRSGMKAALLILWLGFAATSAFAQTAVDTSTVDAARRYRSAPAPLIGLGIPAALAVGGVLVVAKLLKRNR
jgi:hypothetical protein